MASVRATQTKCPEFSASLTIDAGKASMRCAYCGTSLSIEGNRPLRYEIDGTKIIGASNAKAR